MYNYPTFMTSFMVISTDKEKRKTYIAEYCQTLHISKFDQTLIEKDSALKQNMQSIGIEEIKNLQKKIFLKPLQSETKAIIIEDAHLLTVEAQNALLKVLEEPPDHTIIILASESREQLLSTIISRCQVVTLEEEKKTLTEEEKNEFENLLENLPSSIIGDRLKQAELLSKDKEKATEWIEKAILVLREKLLFILCHSRESGKLEIPDLIRDDKKNTQDYQTFYEDKNQYYLHLLKSFQQLHTLLKTTNVNLRFAIEDTLLKISAS
jgi:DNA polymerase III delta prime subunit